MGLLDNFQIDPRLFAQAIGGGLLDPSMARTPGFNPNAPAGPAAPAGRGPSTVVRPEDPPLIKIGKWSSPSANQLMADPRFQVGMGILNANFNGQSPFQGALQGFQSASASRQAQEAERLQAEQQARAEQEWQWKQQEQQRLQEELARQEQLRAAFGQEGLTAEQAMQAGLQYGGPELQGKIIGEMAGGLLGGAGYDPTSQMKNYSLMKELIQTYGRDSQEVRDFMSTFREDPTTRPGTQSFVFDSFSAANTFQANAAAALDISQRLEAAAGRLPAGWRSSGEELIKEVFGTQDDYSILRRDIQKQINANVLQALPPGPATDRDIAEAKKGFPPSNADAEVLARYFRGVAKAQERKAAFEEFKARWASENPSTRGMMDAWYQEYARLFPGEVDQGGGAAPVSDPRTPAELPQ